jgi:hypothetical protein
MKPLLSSRIVENVACQPVSRSFTGKAPNKNTNTKTEINALPVNARRKASV